MSPTASEAVGEVIEDGKVAFFKFTANQGIGVAVAVALLGMLWFGGSWLGVNILEPAVNRLYAHMDSVETRLRAVETASQEQTAILRQIRDDQRKGWSGASNE